jgi:hypothetical protein
LPIGREFVSYLGEADTDTTFELPSFETAVYLTAVLEYLSTEILELSGNTYQAAGLKVMSADHVEKAIKDDAELKHVLHERLVLPIPSPGAETEGGPGCDAGTGAKDGVDKDDGGTKGGMTDAYNPALDTQPYIGDGVEKNVANNKCLTDFFFFSVQ